MNSHSNKNNIPDADMKLKTKNKTEYIEFLTSIIDKALKTKTLEKMKNKKFSK